VNPIILPMPTKVQHFKNSGALSQLIERLQPILPEGWRLIADAQETKLTTFRIATNYKMPDGETVYAYIRVTNSNKELVSISDDGVLVDWIQYHGLYRTFVKHMDDVKGLLKIAGLRLQNGSITTSATYDQVLPAVTHWGASAVNIVGFVRFMRYGEHRPMIQIAHDRAAHYIHQPRPDDPTPLSEIPVIPIKGLLRG
jgi:hypothetical protein